MKRKRFLPCTDDELDKNWFEATGWKDSTTLAIRENFKFIPNRKTFYVTTREFYHVGPGKFEHLTTLEIKHVNGID